MTSVKISRSSEMLFISSHPKRTQVETGEHRSGPRGRPAFYNLVHRAEIHRGNPQHAPEFQRKSLSLNCELNSISKPLTVAQSDFISRVSVTTNPTPNPPPSMPTPITEAPNLDGNEKLDWVRPKPSTEHAEETIE